MGHRIDSKILVVFLTLTAAALGLLWLASEVLEGDTFEIDRAILRGLRTGANSAIPVGPTWLADPMIEVTALGSVTVLTLITIFAVGYLVAIRKYPTALFVAMAVVGGALWSSVLKALFFRSRPDIVSHLVHVSSASFPSGHAMNSAIVYLTLATLLARSQDGVRVRIYLLTVAIVLTMLVGISRVYLGVHWPSDVIARWSVGALWAVLCSLAGKYLQQLRRIDGPGLPTGAKVSD